ncbi:hypothetical protein, partial [Pseudomonas putida]|uniref:hypothetical protein n=1 Tax=Pseudomonas putida TaxID=303 RepID=UPI001C40660E
VTCLRKACVRPPEVAKIKIKIKIKINSNSNSNSNSNAATQQRRNSTVQFCLVISIDCTGR